MTLLILSVSGEYRDKERRRQGDRGRRVWGQGATGVGTGGDGCGDKGEFVFSSSLSPPSPLSPRQSLQRREPPQRAGSPSPPLSPSPSQELFPYGVGVIVGVGRGAGLSPFFNSRKMS
ncbi:MAG: hypothetical protein KME31_13855 [Tolypothrix carrinoi HA7290-LM1]|nr:hypothetical protein [Tolypothrix carrinoi HA7290-LM1]